MAISLDSSRAGQVAYHMFVNPSGIQMDALNTASGEDSAVDWTWQSAGRIDAEGYVVEVRVPLRASDSVAGTDVRMGVMFFRRNSRLGISWSWPEMPPGSGCSSRMCRWSSAAQAAAPARSDSERDDVAATRARRDRDRVARSVTSKGDLGASVKYGVTSTITLDATVNPGFQPG